MIVADLSSGFAANVNRYAFVRPLQLAVSASVFGGVDTYLISVLHCVVGIRNHQSLVN